MKGYIKSESDIQKLLEKVNDFFELPNTTRASLFVAFTKEGYKPRFRYPFKEMSKKLKLKRKRYLPVKHPYGFTITERNIAREIPVAVEEGFNTMTETRPLPNSNKADALPAWEEADSLLFVPASIEKTAQEDDVPDLPDTGADVAPGDDFPSEERENDPTVNELRKILEPSERDVAKTTNIPDTGNTPESFFKSVQPNVAPGTVREMSSYDRALYTALEQKRVEAINNMNVAQLKEIDAEIEKLVEKYSNPVPPPATITDSTSVAASYYRKLMASYMGDLKQAVGNVYRKFAEMGVVVDDVRLGYPKEATFEFIVTLPVKLRLQSAAWSPANMQATSYVETKVIKPVIVRARKEDGELLPYVWTLDGNTYELNREGIQQMMSDLTGSENVTFVVGYEQ